MLKVVNAYYIQGLSQKEISSQYFISTATVSRLLQQAKDLNLIQFSIEKSHQLVLENSAVITKKYQLLAVF